MLVSKVGNLFAPQCLLLFLSHEFKSPIYIINVYVNSIYNILQAYHRVIFYSVEDVTMWYDIKYILYVTSIIYDGKISIDLN